MAPRARRRISRRLRRRLQGAESDLTASLREVEERRAELVEAMKERKILEALKEKQRRSFLLEEARQEQRLTDEVAERTMEYHRRTAGEPIELAASLVA